MSWEDIVKQPKLEQLPETYTYETTDEEGKIKPEKEPEGRCNRKLKAYADKLRVTKSISGLPWKENREGGRERESSYKPDEISNSLDGFPFSRSLNSLPKQSLKPYIEDYYDGELIEMNDVLIKEEVNGYYQPIPEEVACEALRRLHAAVHTTTPLPPRRKVIEHEGDEWDIQIWYQTWPYPDAFTAINQRGKGLNWGDNKLLKHLGALEEEIEMAIWKGKRTLDEEEDRNIYLRHSIIFVGNQEHLPSDYNEKIKEMDWR